MTGGSRGIGAAIAKALGAQGARVVVNYAASAAKADEVAAEIAKLVRCLTVVVGGWWWLVGLCGYGLMGGGLLEWADKNARAAQRTSKEVSCTTTHPHLARRNN